MSNITFATFPIPVITPKGSGYIVYVKCNAMWENDEVCVAMDDGGQWLHFNTGQIKSYKNTTYGINAEGPERIVPYSNSVVDAGIKTTFTSPGWTDEQMVEFAAFYGKQENYMDPESILRKFKLLNK